MDTSNKSSKKKIRKQNHIYRNFQKPKEEAQRLFDIFGNKETCLLVVKEINKEIDSLYDKGLKNIHQVLNTPNRIYRDIINPETEYWNKVEQEILLLKN